MWFKILIITTAAFLCGFSCGAVLIQPTIHSNIEHSENHVDEELFIIEQKSVITVAPKDVCAVYDKELTFEENILNCSRREPILFNI